MSGCHQKTSSLLDDEDVTSALRVFFTKHVCNLSPDKVKRYVASVALPELYKKAQKDFSLDMGRALARHLKDKLVPQLGLKVGPGGISLSCARRWLLREGFRFTAYKKAVYFE